MLQELDHAERYGPMREVPVLKQKYEAQKKVVDALSKKTNWYTYISAVCMETPTEDERYAFAMNIQTPSIP